MSKITPNTLLTDTLNVIALARATALARGGQAQAERLGTVADGLRDVAQRETSSNAPAAAPSGVLAQSDFQSLLAATQAAPATGAGAADRGQVISAMSAGGMGELEIARQLGMTREEVRLMLAAADGARSSAAISSAQVRGRYQQ